ncbi:hypothetical protein SDC9_210015 [bioreactor metagenome]|uniref:Uncharacterized protein n=1 Tax=bioreactor metagenome TaxID=1076179 RepID=A0A645JEZ0_9ZZZZ
MLVPADKPGTLRPAPYEFGGENTRGIEHYRQQIPCAHGPFEVGQVEPEQHHVAGYGVGEHAAAVQVSINVEKSSGNAEYAGGGQAFGVGAGVVARGKQKFPPWSFINIIFSGVFSTTIPDTGGLQKIFFVLY